MMRLYDDALYGLGDGLVGVNFRCRKCGIPYAGLILFPHILIVGFLFLESASGGKKEGTFTTPHSSHSSHQGSR